MLLDALEDVPGVVGERRVACEAVKDEDGFNSFGSAGWGRGGVSFGDGFAGAGVVSCSVCWASVKDGRGTECSGADGVGDCDRGISCT